MRREYNTKQKRELLGFLENRGLQHFSVDDIVFEMERTGEKVSRSTVYRYLELLAEQGSVRKYANAQGITQYQHVAGADTCDNHFHMMCRCCGNLMHVDCDFMAKMAEHLMQEHGFLLDPRETILTGICENCRKAEGANHGADLG